MISFLIKFFHGGLYEPEKYQITVKKDVLPYVYGIYCNSIVCSTAPIAICVESAF